MARPIRIDFEGAIHHVIIKGIEGNNIFYSPEDKIFFLENLKNFANSHGAKIYGYCLMDNHAHLLIETGFTPLSKILQKFLTRYVQWFNKKWDRWGHLLGDRYKSILVDKKSYFLAVLRYIHLNPVKAKITDNPLSYRWSSLKEYMGKPIYIDPSLALSYFYSKEEFYDFHLMDLEEPPVMRVKSQNILIYGDSATMNDVLSRMNKERREAKIRKPIEPDEVIQYMNKNFGLKEISFKIHKHSYERKVLVVLLRDRCHLTWKKIAEITKTSKHSNILLYKRLPEEEHKKILEVFDEWKMLLVND